MWLLSHEDSGGKKFCKGGEAPVEYGVTQPVIRPNIRWIVFPAG
jgi:hypothetical protein